MIGVRINRLMFAVALALGVLVGRGLPAVGSHCGPDGRIQVGPEHGPTHAEHATAAWTDVGGHDCTHCPPSKCSRVASCAPSASGALSASIVAMVDVDASQMGRRGSYQPQPYPSYEPPTPPPQAIS